MLKLRQYIICSLCHVEVQSDQRFALLFNVEDEEYVITRCKTYIDLKP